MSQPWQDYIRNTSNQTLQINIQERKVLEEKRSIFCGIADRLMKEQSGNDKDAMDLFEQMPEEQKADFSRDVIDEGLRLLGIRKKKVKQDKEITVSVENLMIED